MPVGFQQVLCKVYARVFASVRGGRNSVLIHDIDAGSGGASRTLQLSRALADRQLGLRAPAAHLRRRRGGVVAASMRAGDDPAVVTKVIVTAATEPKPKLRYTAGPTAGRV